MKKCGSKQQPPSDYEDDSSVNEDNISNLGPIELHNPDVLMPVEEQMVVEDDADQELEYMDYPEGKPNS